MDERTDRLMTFSFLLGAVALISWIVYVQAESPRVWLALAVVATVGCAATKLQATLRELEVRLPDAERTARHDA